MFVEMKGFYCGGLDVFRINEIEAILANAEVIEKKASKGEKKIGIGSVVEVEYLNNGKTATYTIVGTVEADPFTGKISNASPFGAALIGKKEGDSVEIKVGSNNPYNIKILKI